MSLSFDLRRAQSFFWGLITAPEGVRSGLEEMVRRGEARPGDLDALVAGDERLPAADRLDIYANMYFYRLRDCLKEDYPKLLEAAGPARFHNLITDYLLQHPSAHPSLRHLGAHLPEFLGRHPLRRQCPVLADLARLEWARADIFDAADARPVAREDLARLPQEMAGEARFLLVPACVLLRLEHDAARLWTELKERAASRAAAHGEEAPLPLYPPRRTAVRVWRQGFVVHHRTIDSDEADALEQLRDGEPLGRIAQRLAAGRSAGQATERFGRMFQGWIDDGLLAERTSPAAA